MCLFFFFRSLPLSRVQKKKKVLFQSCIPPEGHFFFLVLLTFPFFSLIFFFFGRGRGFFFILYVIKNWCGKKKSECSKNLSCFFPFSFFLSAISRIKLLSLSILHETSPRLLPISAFLVPQFRWRHFFFGAAVHPPPSIGEQQQQQKKKTKWRNHAKKKKKTAIRSGKKKKKDRQGLFLNGRRCEGRQKLFASAASLFSWWAVKQPLIFLCLFYSFFFFSLHSCGTITNVIKKKKGNEEQQQQQQQKKNERGKKRMNRSSNWLQYRKGKKKKQRQQQSQRHGRRRRRKKKKENANLCWHRSPKKETNKLFFFFVFFLFFFSVRIHSRQLCYCCRTKKGEAKRGFWQFESYPDGFKLLFSSFFFLWVCVSFANVQRAGRVGLTFAKGKTRCSNDIYVRVGCMWACVFVRIKKKNQIAYFSSSFFFFCSLYVGAFATPVLRRKKGLYCVHATRGTGKAAKKKFELLKKKKKRLGKRCTRCDTKKRTVLFCYHFF